MSEKTQGREQSFAGNVAFSVAAWSAPLVLSFVATPYLIRGLGIEQYGYYSLVLAIIGFGFTTGIGKVSAKYIPEYRAAGLTSELSRILSASILLTVCAAVLQGSVLAIATPIIVGNVLNVPAASREELTTAVYFACLIGPMMMVSQVFQSAAQGMRLFRPSSLVAIAGAVALNAGSILLAINGASYSKIFLWNLIVAVVGAVAFYLYVKPQLPELSRVSRPDSDSFKKVGRFALSIFLYQTSTSILFIFERAFVLRIFGSEALTYYTVPLMLGVYLHALVVSFSQVAVPTLNQKLADPKEIVSFYQISTKIVLAVASLVATGYFVLGRTFLSLWLGSDFASNSFSLLGIHGIAFALIAVSVNCWILAEAAHKAGINAFSSITTCVLGVVFMLLAANSYGLDGIAMGRVFGAMAVLPLIPIVEAKVFGSPMIGFWARTAAKLIVSIIASTALCHLLMLYSNESWISFLFAGFVLLIAYAAALAATGFLSITEIRQAIAGGPK